MRLEPSEWQVDQDGRAAGGQILRGAEGCAEQMCCGMDYFTRAGPVSLLLDLC